MVFRVPSANVDDYANLGVKGKIVIYLGTGPKTLPPGSNRLLTARARNAVDKGALAAIGPPGFGRGRGGRGGTAAAPPAGATPAGPCERLGPRINCRTRSRWHRSRRQPRRPRVAGSVCRTTATSRPCSVSMFLLFPR